MKILQVNKYHYPRGGADRYYLDLGKALEDKGHELAYFAMQHPLNLDTPWQKYFVSRISFNENIFKYAWKIPGRVIYSLEAKRKFKKLLQDFKPDIIHYHNIYNQLSPSILDAAKKEKVPMLMHLHDYNLICPNHALFSRGKICKNCLKKKYFSCIFKRCVKNSYLASSLGVKAMWIQQRILKIYEKNLDLLIAPSQFMKETVSILSWTKDKTEVVPNPYRQGLEKLSFSNLESEDKYLLYSGRLSEEKGIGILIEAVSLSPETKLKIMGQGPEEKRLKSLVKKLNLENRVEFLPWQEGEELNKIIAQSLALVLPSLWLENAPLSVLDAFALGVPVIASNRGGLKELINEDNGALYPSEDKQALAKILQEAWQGKLNWDRERIKEESKKYSLERNVNRIIEIYQRLKK